MVRSIVLLAALALGSAASAQERGIEAYVRAEMAARAATVAGMQARLALVTRGAGSQAELSAAEAAERDVAAAFARYGFTAASHAAYGSRRRDAIAAWLQRHPEWAQRAGALDAAFKRLAQRLDGLRGGR